jgi:hypothetical protein
VRTPPQDLAELLKYPFTTGEAEQIVLEQLKAKTQRDFGGDVWKFVDQANSIGITDSDSPAKRPSVQEALKELDAFRQLVPVNPTTSVRGPKYVVKRGKTPVWSREDTKKLLESIPRYDLAGVARSRPDLDHAL